MKRFLLSVLLVLLGGGCISTSTGPADMDRLTLPGLIRTKRHAYAMLGEPNEIRRLPGGSEEFTYRRTRSQGALLGLSYTGIGFVWSQVKTGDEKAVFVFDGTGHTVAVTHFVNLDHLDYSFYPFH